MLVPDCTNQVRTFLPISILPLLLPYRSDGGSRMERGKSTRIGKLGRVAQDWLPGSRGPQQGED
jgi:hypothetical protein